jgi:hypothetical protein
MVMLFSTLALASALEAAADQPAAGAVAAAMRAAVRAEIGNPKCQGGDTFQLGVSYVSSANPRFGFVAVTDNSCSYAFGYFLRRRSSRSADWAYVLTLNDSAQPCTYYTQRLPRAVVAEFKLRGTDGDAFGLCVAASSSALKGLPGVPIYDGPAGDGDPAIRPVRITYTGDGSGFLAGSGVAGKGSNATNLRWTRWTRDQASATGANWLDNCDPDCAAGRFAPEPVTITLSNPRRLGGYLVFTKVELRYIGRLATGQTSRTETMPITFNPQAGGFNF